MGLGRRRRWISPVLAGNPLGLAKPLRLGLISHGLILLTEHKMKRITVPEPEIELYEDGFEGHDMLERAETGKKLSDLVERIDEPLVIALGGAWGSGKSFFLKCWVGEHLKEEKHKAETVYFDAFKHDFLDDPLIALTAAISERLEKEPESTGAKAWKLAKGAAPFLAKTALRLGTMAAVGAAVSMTGDEDGSLNDIGDSMAGEGGDISKELISFWKKEDGKRAAMEQFRTALEHLTQPNKDKEPQQKLVIVVDELDRCRPDYALSLLEIIKHFFDVPGVHFVLGVNLSELQNSVRARYGAGVDAATYLHKFVSLNMPLNVRWNSRSHGGEASDHFRNTLGLLEVTETDFSRAVYDYVELANFSKNISLRDVEQIATKVVVTPSPSSNRTETIVAGLIVCSVLRPNWLQLIRRKKLPMAEFSSIFQFGRSPYVGPHGEGERLLWEWFLGDNSDTETLRGTSYLEAGYTRPDIEDFSSEVFEKYIDVFRMR